MWEEGDVSEPQEGDWVTGDHISVYEYGGPRRLVVRTTPEEFNQAVRGTMQLHGYFPDVWFISDHGNAHLLNVWEDE